MSNSSDVTRRRAGERYEGDLRRSLMDAAMRAHTESGYQQLSLRAVARSIDVSHAAPAHHFGDKAGLLTAIASEGFALLAVQVAEAFDPGLDPVQALKAIGLAYARFADDNPAYYDAMFHRGLHRDDPEFIRSSGLGYDAFENIVGTFQEAGWRAQDDTTALTTATWSLIHGLVTLRAAGSLERKHHGIDPPELIEIAMTLTGWTGQRLTDPPSART